MHTAARRRAARPFATTVACLLAMLVAAAPAAAQDLSDSAAIDLVTAARVEISGARFYSTVDAAGDVNGDGRDDLIVGAPQASHNGRDFSGSAYVIFGQASMTNIDVRNLGPHGFRIDGRQGYIRYGHLDGLRGSAAGSSVAGAGDVNGDGLDDVIVGAPDTGYDPACCADFGEPPAVSTPGSAFVIFGRRSTDTIDLASLGSAGFEIRGQERPPHTELSQTGTSVGGAGDVNGDGLDDLVLNSAPGLVAQVVFGKASSATVQLVNDSLGSPVSYGFRIEQEARPYGLMSVAGAGDVNGDGRADVAIGGTRWGFLWGSNLTPTTYVVFGKASTDTVSLAALGTAGFAMVGQAGSIAGGGDVNGDGRDDVLVGTGASFNGPDSGAVWVVFGKASSTPVDMAAIGAGGFRIDGKTRENIGSRTAIVPDLNLDGRDEVLVGAPWASRNGYQESGSAYLVLGRTSTAKINLGMLGAGGFRIDGPPAARVGANSLAAVGDVTGDGRVEIAVGAGNERPTWYPTPVPHTVSLVNAPALIGLSTTSGPPSTVLRVSGSFFASGEQVNIAFDNDPPQMSAGADAGGNIANARLIVPSTALPGVHVVRAVGAQSGATAQAGFLVRTSWTHAGFVATRTGYNPYENILNRSTVAGLRPLWTGSVAGPFAGSPISVAGNIHVASTAGVVSTFDPLTGALLWSKPTGGTISAGPAAANSTVYVGASDGKVYALDKRFGNQRWVRATGGPVLSAPAVAQSVVYVHSTDGYLYALDANNGSERWKVHVGPNTGASPAVSSSRVHVVSGSDVIALAPATGARLWTHSLAGASDLTTPVVSGSYVYVGSGPSATVHTLTAATGVVRWSRALAEPGPASVSSLVVGEGVVYAQTASALHAVNAADGVPRFARAGAGAASAGATFALANHVLYLPGPRALNSATGALLWSGGEGAGSPSVADGVVYAGASAFRLP